MSETDHQGQEGEGSVIGFVVDVAFEQGWACACDCANIHTLGSLLVLLPVCEVGPRVVAFCCCECTECILSDHHLVRVELARLCSVRRATLGTFNAS